MLFVLFGVILGIEIHDMHEMHKVFGVCVGGRVGEPLKTWLYQCAPDFVHLLLFGILLGEG